MELVKRNILSIIFGVIALIALVALFVPLGGMEEEFQETLKKQAQLDENIRSLLQTPRMKPVITPGNQAEPLEVFPSRTIIEQAKGVTDEVREKSLKVFNTAVQINKQGHVVLVPGALPTPAHTPLRRSFRDAYVAVVTPGQKPPLHDPNRKELGPWNIPDDILNAAMPPTDMEIAKAMEAEWKEKFEQRILVSPAPPNSPPGTPGQELNRPEIVEDFRQKMKQFPQNFRRERARQSPMYLEPAALSRAQNMDPRAPNPPTDEDMWYAQMTLWIQQDVALAIKEMNKGSTSVLHSPVKHLGVLDVNQGFAMYELPTAQGDPYAAAAPAPAPAMEFAPDGSVLPPAAPAASTEGEIPKVYTRAFTGRVCNPLYDVVHFRLVAVVDARHVRRLIQTLQQGRFITVLEADTKQLDLEAQRQQGYDYGSQPVVELSLTGEALFLREWTAHAANAPMPQEVKKKLGVQPKPAADGSTPAPTVAAGTP